MKTLGQINYEAYCAATGGRSPVSGQPLPQWDGLKTEIQSAWEASAGAVGEAVRGELSKLCGARHPIYTEDYQCNREVGHTGSHCRRVDGAEPIWWPIAAK